MKNANNGGEFARLLGGNARALAIEFFCEGREIDFATSDVIRELDMNKVTAYNTMELLLKEKIISKSRVIGKTQLYRWNIKSVDAQRLERLFDDIINDVEEENVTKTSSPSGKQSATSRN